jgi:hypothetical protein
MAALAAGALVVAAASSEPERIQRSETVRMEWSEIFGRLKAALLLPGTGWLLLFIGTYKLGESLSDALYKPFLVDSGFTLPQIGQWSGTWGTVASLIGSAVGGWVATRMPLLGAVGATATLRVFPLFGRWLLALGAPSPEAIIGITLAEEFFGGALTTAMFAFMMSRVDRRVGGAHFTLLAAVELLGKLPIGPVAGMLRDDAGWSYAQVFLLGAGLSVAFLLLLLPMRQRRELPTWRRSCALLLLHAAGPVARESPIVSPYNRSSRSVSRTARPNRTIVDSSLRSRRVAVSASSRCSRTSQASTSVACPSSPMRFPTVRAVSAPVSEWSPGRPLPMSCSSAPRSSRSGRARRATSPSKPSLSSTSTHSATHSSRCRSTVNR